MFVGFFLSFGLWIEASVRREIENEYVRKYENKAIFLRLPVHGAKQMVYVRDTGARLDRSAASQPLFFKVGDQVRITKVDFGGDAVRFKIASIDRQRQAELEFRFRFRLEDHFPQRGVFNTTLNSTFTEGLSYTQIDVAKEDFIKNQFSEFVQQLARSSDASVDFVIGKVAEQFPAYKTVKDQVIMGKKELRKVETEFRKEVKIRRQLESELRQQAGELNRVRASERKLDSLRDELLEDKESLQRQHSLLLSTTREHEEQLKKMTGLDKRVESLSGFVKSLREGRTEISRKLDETNRQLRRLEKKNAKLSEDLKRTVKEKNSLWEDVRTLTSNRKGLEARYIEMKRDRETLETAVDLREALSLQKRLERRTDGAYQVADLYLLSKKIGTLEVRVPEYSGQAYQVSFSLDSPETVKFSEEERRLHEVLGSELRIETSWQTHSENLRLVLLENEPQQTVGPRGTAEWTWLFQGSISEPAHASLIVNLVNAEGGKTFLDSHDFTVAPGNLVDRLLYSFSPISLAAGVLTVTLVVGLLLSWWRRSRPVIPKQIPREKLVVHKRF